MPPDDRGWTLTFGGPVVWGARFAAAIVLAMWLSVCLYHPGVGLLLLAVPLLTVWVIGVLGSFRLESTAITITRCIGPVRLVCRWSEIRLAEVQSVPGFGRVRLVLGDLDHSISFPLFLLSASSRVRLAELLLRRLPDHLRAGWLASGYDRVIRAGAAAAPPN
ncbi:MAG: hypothetical protein H7Y22_08515 [Gemmatimonadaceae bacterium]|nr:hypothetical protein [Gloeobacterales cyanobacterium ES-bin-141]